MSHENYSSEILANLERADKAIEAASRFLQEIQFMIQKAENE